MQINYIGARPCKQGTFGSGKPNSIATNRHESPPITTRLAQALARDNPDERSTMTDPIAIAATKANEHRQGALLYDAPVETDGAAAIVQALLAIEARLDEMTCRLGEMEGLMG